MSGLFKQPSKGQGPNPFDGRSLGMVDPTVELTQPGGPFPYGEGLLTDGAGGYTIAPTLRPYLLSFAVPGRVYAGERLSCQHHGLDSTDVGFVTMFDSNLIGLSISVNQAVLEGNTYKVCVIVEGEVRSTLELKQRDRAFRRDLSEPIPAGSMIGVYVEQGASVGDSAFSAGIVGLELEG